MSGNTADTPTVATVAYPQSMLEALAAETPKEEIHQRAAMGKNGPVMKDGQPMMLAYVTARYVQDRLDTVVGPHNWQNQYESLPTGAVRCGIGITFHRGTDDEYTVWKWDVGVPSSIEPDKGAHSDAFKRAAVLWGIARDLYDERDEDRVQAAPTPAAQAVTQQPAATIQQQVQGAQPVQIEEYDPNAAVSTGNGALPGWVCPVHDDVKVVAAGTSKKTGKPFSAFYACPVAGCDQKAPFGTKVRAEDMHLAQ